MFRQIFPKGSFRHLVAANTVSQLIGRAVSTVGMTIVSILIAQHFGASGYGDFVKITTYVGFFYLFADFGLNAVYIQRAVDDEHAFSASVPWQELFGLRLMMSVLLAGAAMGILLLLPRGSGQGYTPLVRLGILLLTPAIIFQAVTTTTNALFQKILRYDLATHAQNAGSVITLVTAVLFIWLSGVNGAYVGVYAIFAGSVVTALLALFFVLKIHKTIAPLFHWRRMWRIFLETFPLGMTLIFNLVYFHADSVVLTLTRSTQEVGIYGLAYKVFELPLVFPLFFMNAVYPLFLKATRSKSNDSRIMFWQSFWFLLGSAVVIAAIVWFAAPLVTIIRPEFSLSILPLRILIVSLPIFFVSSLFMWILIARKQNWKLFGIHSVAMIGNITANILFIPSHGYIAAAWITGVSELFILLVSSYVVAPLLRKQKGE